MLENVVRTSFTMRRKTLRNNLKPLLSGDEIEQLGIDPSLRPERLALPEFVTISDYLTDKKTATEEADA